MKEYLDILEKYEDKIEQFELEDIKKLIGEVLVSSRELY